MDFKADLRNSQKRIVVSLLNSSRLIKTINNTQTKKDRKEQIPWDRNSKYC